jgi:DNA-binding transcriptional MerR regulator
MVQGACTTARTVRFYEAQKIIAPAHRSRGGHRLFDEVELGKLRLVLDLRTCGFSLEEIREILRAKSRFPDVRESAQEIQRILTRHMEELRRKILVIERLGREFHGTVDVLSRCARCDDPRGPEACKSCDLPAAMSVPETFGHIWAVPRKKSDPGATHS